MGYKMARGARSMIALNEDVLTASGLNGENKGNTDLNNGKEP